MNIFYTEYQKQMPVGFKLTLRKVGVGAYIVLLTPASKQICI